MRRVQSTLFALLAASSLASATLKSNEALPSTPTLVPVAPTVNVPKKPVVEVNSLKAAMSRGEKVYQSKCAVCHQANGMGVPPAFPAIKGSPVTTGPVEQHIEIVLNGKPGTAMQAFKNQLTDQQLADVITYQRNAWGNNMGDLISPDQIAAVRKAVK